VFCVSHHRAVKLCAPLQEKVLVSVWSRRTDADMLAGARHSSDQLGFWSHSKSAVVCRCRKRPLGRLERPQGAAAIHRHHGQPPLGRLERPQGAAIHRHHGQPLSRIGRPGRRSAGSPAPASSLRAGGRSASWLGGLSLIGRAAERERAGGRNNHGVQLISSISAPLIRPIRHVNPRGPLAASPLGRTPARLPSASPTTAPRRAPHGPETCARGKRDCLAAYYGLPTLRKSSSASSQPTSVQAMSMCSE